VSGEQEVTHGKVGPGARMTTERRWSTSGPHPTQGGAPPPWYALEPDGHSWSPRGRIEHFLADVLHRPRVPRAPHQPGRSIGRRAGAEPQLGPR